MAELERRLAGAVVQQAVVPKAGVGGSADSTSLPRAESKGSRGSTDSTGSPQSTVPRAESTGSTDSTDSTSSPQDGSPQASSTQASSPQDGSPQAESNGEPQWPDESAETAFLAQARPGEQLEAALPPELSVPAVAAEAPVEKEVLPKLEDLLPKIPAEVMAALDEHFRAKFTGVRRVPKGALKS